MMEDRASGVDDEHGQIPGWADMWKRDCFAWE